MTCPHCEEDGISIRSIFVAGTALPARCKICGKPSSISGLTLSVTGIVIQIAFLGAEIASFYYWSGWPLIIAVIAYLLIQFCLTKWAPLKAMTEDQVKGAQTSIS